MPFEELPFCHFPSPNTSIRGKYSQTNRKQPYYFPVLSRFCNGLCSSCETIKKNSPILDIRLENRSDEVHRIHRTWTDSNRKVQVLVMRHLKKFHPYWILGWKIDPINSSDTKRFQWESACSSHETNRKNITHIGYGCRKSIRWNPSDPSDTPSFRWKSACSSLDTLRKISPIMDMGVESLSDGVHRIHRRRTDIDGKVHVLVLRHNSFGVKVQEDWPKKILVRTKL